MPNQGSQQGFTPLQARQLFYFYDPQNQSTVFATPSINPQVAKRKVGNVRKYTQTINGTSVILGDREYPPVEITLNWPIMDITDYEALRKMCTVSPIVMVDNNDDGFLGVLDIDEAGQISGKTGNVWAVSATFLVIAPFTGQHTAINALTAPTLVNGGQGTNGYISTGTSVYVWGTFFSPWGETLVGPALTLTASANNASFTVTWTPPSSSFYRKTRLYWNSTNAPTTATLLTEGLAGQSASFVIYAPYAQYNLANPPQYATAFTGLWQGGRWSPLP